MIKITRGLNIPLAGRPKEKIESKHVAGTVGVLGSDYIGMKPSLLVKPDERVQLGQPVFSCKRNQGLIFTAPASGRVVAVNRGEKRAFQSLVIEPDDNDTAVSFGAYSAAKGLDPNSLRELLVESGLWTAIKERPYDKIAPVTGDLPTNIFVSVADTNPAAADPLIIIKEYEEYFQKGLCALEALTRNHLYVCSHSGQEVMIPDLKKLKQESFSGPHPSGNVGTHMHYLSPPHSKSKVWYVGYQDVIAIGFLLAEGRLMTERCVALSGPVVNNPRILKTRIGVDLRTLVDGETMEGCGDVRTISGSILHGHTVSEPFVYLGRYHNQVTMLRDDSERELLGWHMPGFRRFSSKRVFAAGFIPFADFDISTSSHGSSRALVPFGHFERVCAFDTLPTQLLRALLSKDTDTAQDLGVLELGEEDVALFTFVSTGKTDFGPILRENLETIEKEG